MPRAIREPQPPPTVFDRFNLTRVIESLVPTVIVGGLVIFANFKVMQYQVDDIRKELDRASIVEAAGQTQRREQSEKLVGIAAQMTSYLSQQTTLNAQMDARITYLERARR